jgi:hypothetical protein
MSEHSFPAETFHLPSELKADRNRCLAKPAGGNSARGSQMSLTYHLRMRSSPIRIFLQDSFPILEGTKRGSPLAAELSSFLDFDRPRPCRLPTLAPEINQGTIGTAVDYRLRYYFQAYQSSDTVAANGIAMLAGKSRKIGGRFLDYTDKLVARLNPVARELSSDDEAALNTSCVVMAWFEQIYRSGMLFPRFEALLKSEKLEGLLAVVPSGVVQDITQLSIMFQSDAKQLFKPNPVLNPTFSGSRDVEGGADADILVDGILIDFKCTSKVDAPKLRAAALQLLGYVLLDYDGEYDISEIMVYLPRQRCSWRVPLWHLVLPPADVMLAMNRGETDGMDFLVQKRLKKLRQEFRMVARSIQ